MSSIVQVIIIIMIILIFIIIMIVRCSCPDRGWCSLAHTSITFHLYNQAKEVKVRTRHLIITYNTYCIKMLCRSGC